MESRDEIRAALVGAGVGEPTRSELLGHVAITAIMVQEAAAESKRLGKSPGVTVLNLRTALEAVDRWQAEGKPETIDQVKKREWAEGVREHKYLVESEKAAVDALGDADFTRLTEIGRRGEPDWLTDIIEKSKVEPRKSRLIRAAVGKALQAESQNARGSSVLGANASGRPNTQSDSQGTLAL